MSRYDDDRTPDQIRAEASSAIEKANGLKLVREFTIDDYPIGGRNRGKCKLEVEAKRGHGIRTKRTTTNKHGSWCKPKCSTYRNFPTFVATGGDWMKHDGFAYYLVTKHSPLTIAHVPICDAWTIEPALIRGLNHDDVRQQLRVAAAWKEALGR
jgi:hypothetical protein